MQIRKRGNSQTFIRNVYDPKLKRGRAETIGSMPSYVRVIPKELLEKMTDDEVKQVQDQWDIELKERDAFVMKGVATNGVSRILELAHAVDEMGSNPTQIQNMRNAVKVLNRSLRKASKNS